MTATTEESWLTLPDDLKLYTKTWKPSTPLVALIIFVHGFSDHCNAYYTLFPTLASRGILVHTFDQRGWGRSVHNISQRGLTGTTSQVLDDITSVISSQLPTSLPLFLMGHSMGGAEVLHYAARGPLEIRKQIRGYLVESPLVALHPSAQPNKLVVVVGRLAGRVMPRRQMVQKLEAKWLCRDESVCKAWLEDDLCHDTGTLEGLAGMLSRGEELEKGEVMIEDQEKAFWVGHGSGDRVCSFEASRNWFERLRARDKEFKAYDGWYHKLHAEPGEDKITFANDVANWVIARAGKEPAGSAAPTVSSPEAKSKL